MPNHPFGSFLGSFQSVCDGIKCVELSECVVPFVSVKKAYVVECDGQINLINSIETLLSRKIFFWSGLTMVDAFEVFCPLTQLLCI